MAVVGSMDVVVVSMWVVDTGGHVEDCTVEDKVGYVVVVSMWVVDTGGRVEGYAVVEMVRRGRVVVLVAGRGASVEGEVVEVEKGIVGENVEGVEHEKVFHKGSVQKKGAEGTTVVPLLPEQ